jgi:hypothetical protein
LWQLSVEDIANLPMMAANGGHYGRIGEATARTRVRELLGLKEAGEKGEVQMITKNFSKYEK